MQTFSVITITSLNLSNQHVESSDKNNNQTRYTKAEPQESPSYLIDEQAEYPCYDLKSKSLKKKSVSIKGTSPIKKQKMKNMVSKLLCECTNQEFIRFVESQDYKRTGNCLRLIKEKELLNEDHLPNIHSLPTYTYEQFMLDLENAISEPIKEDAATMVDLIRALISINVNKLKSKHPDEACDFQEVFNFLKLAQYRVYFPRIDLNISKSRNNLTQNLPALLFSYLYINTSKKKLCTIYQANLQSIQYLLIGIEKLKCYKLNLMLTYLNLNGKNLGKFIEQSLNASTNVTCINYIKTALSYIRERKIKLFADIHTSDNNKMLIQRGKYEFNSLLKQSNHLLIRNPKAYTWCDLSKAVLMLSTNNQEDIKEQAFTSTPDVNITPENILNNLALSYDIEASNNIEPSNNINIADNDEGIEKKQYFLSYLISVINYKEEYFTCEANTNNFYQTVILYLTETTVITEIDLEIINQLESIGKYLTLDLFNLHA